MAAICHAAQLLAAAGILQGRRCTCYPAVSADVWAAGATYIEVPIDQVCIDQNLVTAPAWPAHPAWLAAFLTVLGTKLETGDRASLNVRRRIGYVPQMLSADGALTGTRE